MTGLTGDQMLKKARGRNTVWDIPRNDSATDRLIKGFETFIANALNISIVSSGICLLASPLYAVSIAGLAFSEVFYSVYGYITWDMAKTLSISLIARMIAFKQWNI